MIDASPRERYNKREKERERVHHTESSDHQSESSLGDIMHGWFVYL